MRRWLRIGLVVVFGGVALYALFAFATGFRATRLVNRLLHDWATQQVVEQSDSLYRLHIGRLHFNWPLRRITLDSAVITTDSARNAARTYPGATLNGALRTCVISGVDIVQLVLARGLEATQIGCAVVSWHAEVPADSTAQALYAAERASGRPRPRPAPAARTQISLDSARRVAAVSAATTTPQGLSTFQSRLRLPSQVPRIHIGRITFPALGTRLLQHSPSGDRAEFDLARCAKKCGDSRQAREANVAAVRLLEEAADYFESVGQQETRSGVLRHGRDVRHVAHPLCAAPRVGLDLAQDGGQLVGATAIEQQRGDLRVHHQRREWIVDVVRHRGDEPTQRLERGVVRTPLRRRSAHAVGSPRGAA